MVKSSRCARIPITSASDRRDGITRVNLETGSGEKFEPALALYRQHGFVNGPAFADYRLTKFNRCLNLDL